MDTIMNVKDITGTSRLYFENKLSVEAQINLLKNFREKQDIVNIIRKDDITLKIMKKDYSLAIEITPTYISFFPQLDAGTLSQYKKEVYRIVANRFSVYNKGALENLEAAKIALLSSNYRAYTSLIYYSLHKIMSGKYYRLLNTELDLLDIDIIVTDLGHYTSQAISSAEKRLLKNNAKLTRENYITTLKGQRGQVNPFIAAKYEKNILNGNQEIDVFLETLCIHLFDVKLEEVDSAYFKHLVEQFKQAKEQQLPQTQESQVVAAIALCFENIKNDLANESWKFFVLALRLYWLRQNADYDYDFEIKMSLRELSLIYSIIKSICSDQTNQSEEHLIKEEFNKKEITIKNNEIEGKSDERNFEIDLKNVKSINAETKNDFVVVDFEFNFKKINLDIEKPLIFMSCLHIDSKFNQHKTFTILNSMINVKNCGNYFSFHDDELSFYINLYISGEGKWTFWIPNHYKTFVLVSEADLIDIYNRFWENFVKLAKQIGFNEEFKLIKTYPINLKEKAEILSFSSLENSYEKYHLAVRKVKRNFSNIFSGRYEYLEKADKINIFIDCNMFSEDLELSMLPSETVMSGLLEGAEIESDDESKYIIIFNLLMYSEEEIYSDKVLQEVVASVDYSIDEVAIEKNNNIISVKSIPLALSNNLNLVNEKKVNDSMLEVLNEVIYLLVEKEDYSTINDFIEEIDDDHNYSHLMATKGLYYLRTTLIDDEGSLELGSKYYNMAINNEQKNESKYEVAFVLKSNIELARYNFYKLCLTEEALKILESVESLVENEFFSQSYINIVGEYFELKNEIENSRDEESNE